MLQDENITMVEIENFASVGELADNYEEYALACPIRAGHLMAVNELDMAKWHEIHALGGYLVLRDRQ